MTPSSGSTLPATPSFLDAGTGSDNESGLGTVAVIGLGLIGGSIARDLAAMGVRVVGYDRDAAAVRDAVREGVVSAGLGEDGDDGAVGWEEVDVVIVATPVDRAPSVMATLGAVAADGRLNARLITDVCSTKQSILGAAIAHGLGNRFVGSHPIAGDHRWGWSASREGLFAGARVYICPTETTEASALELVGTLWDRLGAVREQCSADVHDETLALSSHLPQLTTTALALVLRQGGVGRSTLGPGGRDSTRLAGSSPELWTGIARDNAEPLGKALELLERQIAELRAGLVANDEAMLRDSFRRATEWFITTSE